MVCSSTVLESRKAANAYPFLGARAARCHVLPPSDVRKLVAGANSELHNCTVPSFASTNEAETRLQALAGTPARAGVGGIAAIGGARLGLR
jgi:hypothetical protein